MEMALTMGEQNKITLNITKTTGGAFTVSVDSDITVEFLKKIVSKKLKISKERICLMNSERELQDGTLKENGIVNGSKIVVTPNVETGLAQRAENTVMQALESLNDNQVNDFLSGKSPLNLSVRLGDHMMLIQLQLSTLSPSQQNSLKQKVANAAALKQRQSIINCTNNNVPSEPQPSTSGCQKRSIENSDESAPEKQRMRTDDESGQVDDDESNRSPIKSLSSMVSSPLTTTVQNMNHNKFFDTLYKAPSPSPAANMDPIAANLTSCLCKRLNSCNNNCEQRPSPADDEPCCSYSEPRTNVISEAGTSSSSVPSRVIPFHNRPSNVVVKPKNQKQVTASSSSTSSATVKRPSEPTAEPNLINTDNPALAEASRNLTQTLRKLSKRVFTSKNPDEGSAPGIIRRTAPSSGTPSTSSSSGAVIESMKHHGKGIYSGTFSGTLNPALQDKNGRPKRDISTIIHILNDLLSATPQCGKNGAKIFFEPTQSPTTGLAGPKTAYIKLRKQSSKSSSSSSSSSCTRCVPTVPAQQQKCSYGECNGHSKTEIASNSSGASTSTSNTRGGDCTECHQTVVNRKLEFENAKTKNKMEQLRLVMQQKKERREARKLKISPYNVPHTSTHLGIVNQSIVSATTVPVPLMSTSNSLNGSLELPANESSSSDLNGPEDGSSSATATAIATSITTNNSEIENHLEEVDTVA